MCLHHRWVNLLSEDALHLFSLSYELGEEFFITMSFSIQRKFSIKIVEISSINKELIVKQTIQLQNNQFSSSSVLLFVCRPLSSFYFDDLSIVHWCFTEKHCRRGRSRKLYRRTAEKERENLNGAFGARGAAQYVTELVGSRCTN